MEIRYIAHIENDLEEKFGIPRQSGLVPQLQGRIVFEEEFRDPRAVEGLEEFSHIWLLWIFSESVREGFTPTVRPPRLGGNERVGVFATRSPFRPNPIGLSCVKLERIEIDEEKGPVLHVSGADLLSGTPILDIKPYLSFTDSHPEAVCGFADTVEKATLETEIPEELLELIPEDRREALIGLLRQDPRPAYQHDPERIYGLRFAGQNIRFRVDGGRLRVVEVSRDNRQE